MKLVRSCSLDHWAVERLSFRDPKFHRQHVRKRRIPLPRQARGRDLDAEISYGTNEFVSPAAPTQIEPEANKLRSRIQFVLWICVMILSLVLFGDWLVHFFREVFFAWPSINGSF